MSSVYFTSDTHFGHANIIKYSKRPFKDAREMDEALIANWNMRVRPEDQIYHLGDFGFGREEYLDKILSRLNGVKYFIRGNHDKAMKGKILDHFEWTKDYYELNVNGQKMILCHYPMVTWNKARHGSWMLHGHCHHSLDYMNEDTTRLDVGVDGFGYSPISIPQIKNIMDKKKYKVVDHHGKDVDYVTMDEL